MQEEAKVLYNRPDSKGRPFVIETGWRGGVAAVIEELKAMASAHPTIFAAIPDDASDEEKAMTPEQYWEDDEYSITHCQMAGEDRHPTIEERIKEIDELNALIKGLEENPEALLQEWFEKIPRKQNGTFAKGRITSIWEGETYSHLWEDSYGYGGPVLLLRSQSDYRATLEVESRIIYKF